LQVVLQREGAAFAVVEGVEKLIRGDDSNFVLLGFAQTMSEPERCCSSESCGW
jgi:hypothetical protein